MSLSSDLVTRNIRVTATAQFIEDESNPSENRFFYAYRITIKNEGSDTVQLLSRYWLIINSFGEEREVHGDGVVGKMPTLSSGQSFEYISGCPLETDWGTMEGHFTMMNQLNEKFDVKVGRFYLTVTEQETLTLP
jgi:ApaG protein